jgi:hypothetical protein
MKAMGFLTTWRQWTSTLYENAITSVLLNGENTKELFMEKGIRQGCPLASHLYLLVVNVLNVMLVDPIHQVEGLTLFDELIL